MRSILILILALGAANPAAAHQRHAYAFGHVNANVVRGSAPAVQVAAAAAQGVPSSLRPRNPINRVIPWDQTATTSNAALPECGFAAETDQSTNIHPCDPRNVYLTR